MYQSFPQRRMCSSNSAMPIIKPQNNKNYCENKKENIEKSDNCKTDSENYKNIESTNCDEEIKQECCDEKSLCVEKNKNDSKRNPLNALFGDLFKNFEIDDLILIGLILFLLYEGEDDIIIIGILALILFL